MNDKKEMKSILIAMESTHKSGKSKLATELINAVLAHDFEKLSKDEVIKLIQMVRDNSATYISDVIEDFNSIYEPEKMEVTVCKS